MHNNEYPSLKQATHYNYQVITGKPSHESQSGTIIGQEIACSDLPNPEHIVNGREVFRKSLAQQVSGYFYGKVLFSKETAKNNQPFFLVEGAERWYLIPAKDITCVEQKIEEIAENA